MDIEINFKRHLHKNDMTYIIPMVSEIIGIETYVIKSFHKLNNIITKTMVSPTDFENNGTWCSACSTFAPTLFMR